MSTDCEAWERIVADVAKALERNPAMNQRDFAAQLLRRCKYEIADVVYPYAPSRSARVAASDRVFGDATS